LCFVFYGVYFSTEGFSPGEGLGGGVEKNKKKKKSTRGGGGDC